MLAPGAVYPRRVIREAGESDFEAGIDVIERVWPHAVSSVAGWLHTSQTEPAEAQRHYWAAEDGGRMIGWASAFVVYESAERPGSFRVSVVEEQRGRGVGGALYERCAEHLASLGAAHVGTRSQDDPAAAAFLRARGFRHVSTSQVSGLDPTEVAPGVAPDGIVVLPLAALDPELVFALDAESSRDIPNEDNDDLRFEQWHADYWSHPDIDLESSVAAVADGIPVSYSLLYVCRDRGMSGMTGTLRAQRGRGLAELVKRATLVNAAARGVSIALTHNDATNAPMLHINDRLGYRPLGELLGWERSR